MLQEFLLDAHNAYHVHQIVNSPLDLVLNKCVLFNDVVLKLQILKGLDHLLNLATYFSRVFVFEVLHCGRDLLAPFGQILVFVLATPVTVSSKELRDLCHVVYNLILVLCPHLRFLLDDLSDELLYEELKLTQAQK